MAALEPAMPTRALHLATANIRLHRILVALDFSRQTQDVLKTALRFATAFDAELFLVHAATCEVHGTVLEPVPVVPYDLDLQRARDQMRALVDRNSALMKLRYRELVAYAHPVELVHRIVQEKGIDLVVAGSHGASGMERLALGSVAERILRGVHCPVLVVGPHAEPAPQLFESILLATDLAPGGLRSAQYAASLAEHFRSKLTLLHVVEPRHKNTVQPDLLEDDLIGRLQELIPQDFATYATATPRLEYGKAADRIADVAVCIRPTLIVTGAGEDRSLSDHIPWSVLGEVVRRAPAPVLCVREHPV